MVDWLSPGILLPELHAVIGALAVLTAYAFVPGRLGDAERPTPWFPRLAVTAFVVVVLVKESVWDPVNEVAQPFFWAGATDLFYYLVGIAVMALAVRLRFGRL